MAQLSERRKALLYLLLIAVSAAISVAGGLDLRRQVPAVTIFSSLILGTLLFWRFRLAFALVSALALFLLGLIDTRTFIEFASVDIVLFLVGMMILIGFLEERHFFEHLIDRVVGLVGGGPRRLMVVMMLLSYVFAALVDEVTSILFMSAAMFHLAERRKVSPVPYIIMLVFATNIGSSATVVGNPIGVLIAFKAGLTFADFLRWALPVSLAALLVTIPLSLLLFRRQVKELGGAAGAHPAGEVQVSARDIRISALLFTGTLAMLALHHPLEEALHLQKNAMLLGTALGAGGIALFLHHEKARELVEKRVDWWTLAFFLFFFASVGTLHFTGVTDRIAQGFTAAVGRDPLALVSGVALTSGVSSGFMDNVLAVATFIPVLQQMGEGGVAVFPLWWALLFGGTYGGNLTLIGSTANIVALGLMERRGHKVPTFIGWLKPGLAVTVPTLLVAILLTYLQIPLMPR